MTATNLERLLCLLDVRLHVIALCEVGIGWRLKMPPMESVLVHYVLQGKGVVRSEDGTVAFFGPGTLLFLPAGYGHELAAIGDEPNVATAKDTAFAIADGLMRFSAGGSQPEIVTVCGTISADYGNLDLFQHMREPIAEDASDSRAIQTAFSLLVEELSAPRFGTRALCEALMKQCLIVALRAQMERGDFSLLPIVGLRDPRLMRALLEMLEHPAADHNLDDLAKISGMSRSLFAERFAEAFDRPPMDLLKQIRLHRAAHLLRSTTLPIQVIAMAVGYASRSYFSRAFRAAFGRDPKAFRERAQSGGRSNDQQSGASSSTGEAT